MVPTEYKRLFEALHLKTIMNEIDWVPGSRNDEFIAGLGENSLKLYRGAGGTYFFAIFSKNNRELDSFTVSNFDESYTTASEIEKAARRKALNVDQAIGDIEKFLGLSGRPHERGPSSKSSSRENDSEANL